MRCPPIRKKESCNAGRGYVEYILSLTIEVVVEYLIEEHLTSPTRPLEIEIGGIRIVCNYSYNRPKVSFLIRV